MNQHFLPKYLLRLFRFFTRADGDGIDKGGAVITRRLFRAEWDLSPVIGPSCGEETTVAVETGFIPSFEVTGKVGVEVSGTGDAWYFKIGLTTLIAEGPAV